MSFNDNVQIDTSRVDTSSGGGGMGGFGGGGGGGPVVFGGGIVGLILTILFMVLQGALGGGGGMTAPADDSGQVSQQGSGTGLEGCKTGADANKDVRCRMAATENSLQAYWSEQPQLAQADKFSPIGKLALYSGSTQSQCGTASNQVGPFYCPLDQGIYLDTDFFSLMEDQLGAQNGNLAQMYIMAHEYGHHIQDNLDVLKYAQQDPQGEDSGGVRVELMADCFAGMWLNAATTTTDEAGTAFLKPFTDEEIQNAIGAAKSVGDDSIQERSSGQVNPDQWTHGSSKARMAWLQKGMGTNDINTCDTLNATDLGN